MDPQKTETDEFQQYQSTGSVRHSKSYLKISMVQTGPATNYIVFMNPYWYWWVSAITVHWIHGRLKKLSLTFENGLFHVCLECNLDFGVQSWLFVSVTVLRHWIPCELLGFSKQLLISFLTYSNKEFFIVAHIKTLWNNTWMVRKMKNWHTCYHQHLILSKSITTIPKVIYF